MSVGKRFVRCWTILLVCLVGMYTPSLAQPGDSLCATERVRCFLPTEDSGVVLGTAAEPVTRPLTATMTVRALHGGILAHQWVELLTERGTVTIGYGPASLPFIDAGQISVWDQSGNVERSGLRLIPTGFNYAKPPGAGHIVGKSIELTPAQSDAVLRKESHRKAIFPYIPLFHDCHTFVCTVKATASGKSTLPCYLLFKGYW